MVNTTQINKVLYDEVFAGIYDATHPRMHASNYANRLFVDILSEIILSIESEACQVLDIGCGTGGYARSIIERFSHTFLDANDISMEMLNVFAAKLSPEVRARFRPLCMDASSALRFFWGGEEISLHMCGRNSASFRRLPGHSRYVR